MMVQSNFREPVIALSYSEKDKATVKELLVNYDTGDIYVVSATDKSVIFDITKNVKDKIKDLDGGQVQVTIEGIGSVNLTDLLSRFNTELSASIQIVETEEDTQYAGRENVMDNTSIEIERHKVQLKDFSKAPNLSIPRKKDGVIEWVDCDEIMARLSGDSSEDTGNIIGPSNPNDGNILYCYDLNGQNGKIFLRASKRQRSMYLSDEVFKVIIPKTLDQHCEIEWYIVTNSKAPTFTFMNNIVWRNEDVQPVTEGHQIYNFKTYDFGHTWLGELVIYDGNKSAHGIDTSYIDSHFYSKVDADRTFITKKDIKDTFVDRDELKSNYISKTDMTLHYYNKDEINKFLSWKKRRKSGDK